MRSHYGASAEESSGREPTTIGKGRQVRHPAHHTTGGSLQQSERPPGSTAKSAMPPRHTIRRGGAQTRPCELKTATPAERRPRDHPTPYGPLPCHPGVRITRPEGPRGPSHATLYQFHPGVRITRPEGPRGPSHATLIPRGENYTTGGSKRTVKRYTDTNFTQG